MKLDSKIYDKEYGDALGSSEERPYYITKKFYDMIKSSVSHEAIIRRVHFIWSPFDDRVWAYKFKDGNFVGVKKVKCYVIGIETGEFDY